jgi:hypothetical protein
VLPLAQYDHHTEKKEVNWCDGYSVAILTAVLKKIEVFWNMTPHPLQNSYRI